MTEKPCEHFKSWAEMGLRTNQCQYFDYHNGGVCKEGIFQSKPCEWRGYPEGTYQESCYGKEDVPT